MIVKQMEEILILTISYVFNFPSGAVIILVAGLAYVLAALIRSLLLRRQVPEEGIAVIG